jgi:ATP-dependent helicase HepA
MGMGEADPGFSRVGDFVVAEQALGIGRLIEIGDHTSTVRYFKGPFPRPFEDLEYPTKSLQPARISLNTRVFFQQQGHWRVARVDAAPTGEAEPLVLALPNLQGVILPRESVEIRWRRMVDEPFEFLWSGATESPMLYDQRVSILGGWHAQRAAARGVGGLFNSSVELHPHQLSAVRRVTADSIHRYLLADEVGLGKTIEAAGVIKEVMSGVKGRVLVIAPDHLVDQWTNELESRFHLPVNTGHVTVLRFGEIAGALDRDFNFVVIDEAHHMTRTGGQPESVRKAARTLALNATDLLLLTATPVRSNEAGFLDLLTLLDPLHYREDDLASFTQRVEGRQQLALIHRSLDSTEDKYEFAYLASQLVEMFPDDATLRALINSTSEAPASEFLAAVHRVRTHLSEVYRLHHRMIRTRRSPELTRQFGVRGRRRGRPFTLEIDDATDVARTDLLELLRSRLAATSESEPDSTRLATRVFKEAAGRCGALAPALSELPRAIAAAGEAFALSQLLGEEDIERIEVLSARISDSWVTQAERFTDALSERVVVHKVGRVVLASAYAEVAKAAHQAMSDRWGGQRVALHSVGQSAEMNSREVERWRNDPTCTLLFCDASAEEGINLQDADVLVHLDLPWQMQRLEQRLGRCDRFQTGTVDPVSSLVLTYGDQPFASSWFEFAADAAHVFDGSVSSLQYVLAEAEDEFARLAVATGSQALGDSLPGFRQLLEAERISIAAQDSLDSATDQMDTSSIDTVDKDRSFTAALTQWLEGVGCKSQSIRPGVTMLSSRGRVQLPLDLETVITRFSRTPLALSRSAAVEGGLEPLRAGHPLVDEVAAFLAKSDRGAAYTMFRHATGIWPPAIVGRADYLVRVRDSDLAAVNGLDDQTFRRAAALVAELLPTRLETVWFLPDGREADHSSVTRPYDKSRGDINLGSRPELFAKLTTQVNWETFCSNGHGVATQLLRDRIRTQSWAAEGAHQILTRLQTESDQRRTRSQAGLGDALTPVPEHVLAGLADLLMSPAFDPVGAGAVLLADRSRLGLP